MLYQYNLREIQLFGAEALWGATLTDTQPDPVICLMQIYEVKSTFKFLILHI